MKKNLFDAGIKDDIIERSMKLTEQSQGLWGSMNSAEMLRHCSEVLTATMAGYKTAKPDTIKQRIFRFLVLNVIPKFPKGAKTLKQLDMKQNSIVTLGLREEQEAFVERVNSFINYSGNFNSTHPYFGNLSRKQWGIMTWMHLDHHLRQFGV